jgi:hypothetical protein
MSRAWLSSFKPTKPAPRPRRLRQRDEQAIPRAERPVPHPQGWDWAPECEEVVGPPGNRLEDVLARCREDHDNA